MGAVKLMVIYPRPTGVDAFETLYNEAQVPLAVKNFVGKTRIVATKVVAS